MSDSKEITLRVTTVKSQVYPVFYLPQALSVGTITVNILKN